MKAGASIKQLSVNYDCTKVDGEALSELLFELGVLSVSTEVLSEDPKILNDEKTWSNLGKQKSWKTALLRANIPYSFDSDFLITILKESFPESELSIGVSDVEDIDWVSKVQSAWTPQVIGDLTVMFPWHDPKEHAINTPHRLILEGGAAFGTGDHPTTRLCLCWLQNHSNGKSVLDYGCGSAILAMAASLYGASNVVGTDIDQDSLVSARHNAVQNGIDVELFSVVENTDAPGADRYMNQLRGAASQDIPPPVEALNERDPFDVVVANILAPILIDLSEEIDMRLVSGGSFALSGVVTSQADSVVQAYTARSSFRDVRVESEEDGWVLITGRKV